jgi:hypothetical protein
MACCKRTEVENGLRYLAELPNLFRLAITTLVLLFSIALFLSDSQANECTPSARLEGAPEIVQKIEASLKTQGVDVAPTEGCPVIWVWAVPQGRQVFVKITDSYGRTSEKTVDDANSAAVLIESWARSELGLGWVEPVETEPAPEEPTPEPEPEPTPEPEPEPVLAVLIGTEGSWGIDNSYWVGPNLAVRGKVGPIELGGQARFSWMLAAAKEHEKYAMSRYVNDLLFTLSLPIRPGAFYISPGLGFGASWMRTWGKALDEDALDDAAKHETFDTWGPIGQANVVAGWRSDSGFGLAAEMGFRIYAPPQSRNFVRGGRHLPGEPTGFVGVALHMMVLR